MITLRLEKSLESAVDKIALKKGTSRSEVIRESIEMYVRLQAQTPYLAGKDLFGKYSSEKTDLAANAEKYLRGSFGTKK